MVLKVQLPEQKTIYTITHHCICSSDSELTAVVVEQVETVLETSTITTITTQTTLQTAMPH